MREGLSVLALVISLGLTPPVQAQSTDPIQAICTSFLMANNLRAGASPDILCGCLVREITTQMSTDEMIAYQRSIQNRTPMADSLSAKINGIAETCLSEGR